DPAVPDGAALSIGGSPGPARLATTAPADASFDVVAVAQAGAAGDRQPTQIDGGRGSVDLEHARAVDVPRKAPAADREPVSARSLDCQVLGDPNLLAIAEGDGEGRRGRVVTGVGGRNGELDGVAALGGGDLGPERAGAAVVECVGDGPPGEQAAALERLQPGAKRRPSRAAPSSAP